MRPWIKGLLWAALLMPIGIVLHEAGHYLGYLYFDLPGATLSYASGGFTGMRDFWIHLRDSDLEAACAIAPILPVGITALLGPLVTIALGSIGLIMLLARNSMFGGALAFTSFFRAAPIALQYIRGNTIHSDEAHIAITLGISDLLVFAAQLLGLIASGWVVTARFGWRTLLAIVIATGASLAVWMAALGPILLPE